MGDVGDELGLHPLRLHLLLHRVLDALADVVQVFPVLPEGPPQVLCGHFVVQMAGGQLAAPRLEGPHGEDHEEHQSPLQHLQQQPEHHPAAAVIAAHQAQALQEAQQEEAQAGGPEQGQLSQQLPRPPPQSLAPTADRPDQAGEEQVLLPNSPSPPADQGEGHGQHNPHQRHGQHRGPEGHQGGAPAAGAGHRQKPKQQNCRPRRDQQVRGDGPVHPAEGNLLRALLAQPRRPEQESQAEQAQHQPQDGPRQKFIPVEAHILRVLDALIDLAGGGELRPEKARQNHRLFAHRAGNIRGEAVSFLIFYQRHILKLLIRAAQLVQGKVPGLIGVVILVNMTPLDRAPHLHGPGGFLPVVAQGVAGQKGVSLQVLDGKEEVLILHISLDIQALVPVPIGPVAIGQLIGQVFHPDGFLLLHQLPGALPLIAAVVCQPPHVSQADHAHSHGQHEQPAGKPLGPGFRTVFLHSLPPSILYPCPQTTLMYRGSEGLISSFSRR